MEEVEEDLLKVPETEGETGAGLDDGTEEGKGDTMGAVKGAVTGVAEAVEAFEIEAELFTLWPLVLDAPWDIVLSLDG